MRHPRRLSLLFFIGLLIAGSSALGYYYYFVYEPPLAAAEAFMQAMQKQDRHTLKHLVRITPDRDSTNLREPKTEEIDNLLKEPFHRGRILDQDPRDGASGDYDFLIYRQPDGDIYALLVAKLGKDYKIIVPERPHNPQTPYLWDYDWTN